MLDSLLDALCEHGVLDALREHGMRLRFRRNTMHNRVALLSKIVLISQIMCLRIDSIFCSYSVYHTPQPENRVCFECWGFAVA